MPDTIQLERESKRTLQRLLPRVEQELFNSVSTDPRGCQEFTEHLQKYFPSLFSLYFGLYSTRYDFFFHLEDLLISLARAWFAQLQNLKQQGTSIPKLYVACGLEDTLHEMNTRFRDLAYPNSIPLTYEEGPGRHTWDFWDQYICRALNWLDRNLIQGKRID